MNIGIFTYENAEVLDFAGPFEVLSTAKRLSKNAWNIFLIGQYGDTVNARGGFLISPHYSFRDCPELDVLIVPGGIHTTELDKREVISWIAQTAGQVQVLASVCTGAFLLAEAGLLDGRQVTTHWEDIADLRHNYPKLDVRENLRWIEQGKIITSAGISAGIDMSLHLVSKMASPELAVFTARQMDYPWHKDPS